MQAILHGPMPPRNIFPAGFPLGSAVEREEFLRVLDSSFATMRDRVAEAWDNGQPIEYTQEATVIEQEQAGGFVDRELDGGKIWTLTIARQPTPDGWRVDDGR